LIHIPVHHPSSDPRQRYTIAFVVGDDAVVNPYVSELFAGVDAVTGVAFDQAARKLYVLLVGAR